MFRFIAITACLLLAACAGGAAPEDAFVAPGKYVLYDCSALAAAEMKYNERDRDLERLMARAKSGQNGSLVAATVYEPEALSVRGELKDIHREQADKKCPANTKPAPASVLPPAD